MNYICVDDQEIKQIHESVSEISTVQTLNSNYIK
jgi:hypothetical protein